MALTKLPAELVRSTGTLTVEKAEFTAQTGNPSLTDHRTDKNTGNISTDIFEGKDSLGNATTYASVTTNILDNTDTSEGGSLAINTALAGTLTTSATFSAGLFLGAATGGDQGAGTINATGYFVNGVALGGGSGDVVGPVSSTDNSITRFDGITGKLVQNSGITIDDSDNMTISGDLTVNGTTTTVNSATVAVTDSLFVYAKDNATTDVLDIGFVGLYDTTGTQDLYAGCFRDATDDKFHMFTGSQEDLSITNVINKTAIGYSVATLVANLEGNVTGTVSTLSNHDTDGLTEGATNKYASTANVNSAGAVMEIDFDAQTILMATANDMPLPVTFAPSTFSGRKATGDIGAMTAAEARTVLNVADGSEANIAPNKAIRVAGVDFVAGTATTLTLPSASPSDAEANVSVNYDGLEQHSSTWSISGATLTLSEAIPAFITNVELVVWA